MRSGGKDSGWWQGGRNLGLEEFELERKKKLFFFLFYFFIFYFFLRTPKLLYFVFLGINFAFVQRE